MTSSARYHVMRRPHKYSQAPTVKGQQSFPPIDVEVSRVRAVRVIRLRIGPAVARFCLDQGPGLFLPRLSLPPPSRRTDLNRKSAPGWTCTFPCLVTTSAMKCGTKMRPVRNEGALPTSASASSSSRKPSVGGRPTSTVRRRIKSLPRNRAENTSVDWNPRPDPPTAA